MRLFLIGATFLVSGCAAGQQKAVVHQKVAWVPCDVEVVAYEDTSKTVAKTITTHWYCENRN